MVKLDRLPANVDAERLLLGSIMLDESHWDGCADALTADDFSLEKHRFIWGAMSALHEGGKSIDRVTLIEELQRTGKLDACDGIAYVTGLDDGLPRVVNLESYIRIVRDKAVLRRTAYACQNILGRILSAGPDEPLDLLADGEHLLASLKERLVDTQDCFTPAQIVRDAGGLDGYLARRESYGVTSPWARLNRYTHGLQPGELVILGAGTGMGKTALALSWTQYAARHGVGVVFFSMEMHRREINDRLLSAAGMFDSQILWRKQEAEDRAKIARAAIDVNELPIWIRDKSTCTVPGVAASVRRLKAKHSIGLVVVDYLQLMTATGKHENRTQEVSSFSRGLKRAAQELELPFLVLSQLNRKPGQEKRPPELSDLRESGTIEQDANLVLFLHGTYDYQSNPSTFLPIQLLISKQRRGPARIEVPLLFRADCGRFEAPVEDE